MLLSVNSESSNLRTGSLKVMVMLTPRAPPVSLIAGLKVTDGAVVSITIALFVPSEPDEPCDGNVRVASLEELSRIVPLLADRELVD